MSFRRTCGSEAPRPRKAAFTLTELLVTLVIIAILAALTLSGLATARQRVKIDRTKNTIRKIHEIVMPQYESYARRRVPAAFSGNGPPVPWSGEAFSTYVDRLNSTYYGPRLPNGVWPPVGSPPAAVVAQSRLQMLRMIQILELPDSWGDVATASNLVISGGFSPSYARTGPVSSYASFREHLPAASQATVQDTNGSAECLYLIVACGGFESDVMEQFRGDEIGDTDNDGAPEFIDAWARPIQFIRWAPGVSAAGFPRPSAIQIANVNSSHDPLDPMRVDTGGYALVPLIYSEGPDGVADSLVTTGTGGWRAIIAATQSLLSVIPQSDSEKLGRVGPFGPSAVTDNISNHDLMSK